MVKTNLKSIMLNNGILEAELCRGTKISQPTISRYRNGVDIPNLKKANTIVKVMNRILNKNYTINDIWSDYQKQYRANLVITLKARASAGRKGGKAKRRVAKKK